MVMKEAHKIEIINYEDRFALDFKSISLDWFESNFFKEHFSVEDIDRMVISNPSKYIIEKGGHIFFARLGEKIVGTAALINSEDSSFELSKVGVLQVYRGLKISDDLIKSAIIYSKVQGKKTLWLESIRILKPALAVFKKYGFKEVPLNPESHYARADIKMELIL